MSEEPGTKRKRTTKWKFYRTHRENEMAPGQRGFLATCNFDEKKCLGECLSLLKEYANELYGLENVQDLPSQNEIIPHKEIEECDEVNESKNQENGQKNGNENGEKSDELNILVKEKDIMDELDEKIKSESLTVHNTVKRFQPISSDVLNCIYIKTTIKDPAIFVHHIATDIGKTKHKRWRHLIRLLPIDYICKCSIDEISKTGQEMAEKYFKEPVTFAIIVNRKKNKSMNKDSVINSLANIITSTNEKHRVDLNNPQRTLIVTIIKNLCCFSVTMDYKKLKKYNFTELVETTHVKVDDTNEEKQLSKDDKDKNENTKKNDLTKSNSNDSD